MWIFRIEVILFERLSIWGKQKEIADSLPDDHNKDWSALDRLFLEMLGD